MKAKLITTVFLTLVLTLAWSVSDACALSCCKAEIRQCNDDNKLFYKAELILRNQEELGLSDEQVERIKDLKLKARKDLIKSEAEIEIIALDINAKMMQEATDIAAINKLIDEKYELEKARAKSLVKAYAELKGILTEEQKKRLKDLHKKCKTARSKVPSKF